MKINKRKPRHWYYLAKFTICSLLGLVIRPFQDKSHIIFYGHKLNGNLLPIYNKCSNAIFLSMDHAYCRKLKEQGFRSQWACAIGASYLLGKAQAIVSDHGLHSLEPLLPLYKKLGLKFFDVWHGIPFKGFDARDFRLQHQYDEVWVASPLHRELYVNQYGFEPEKVTVTGYARTDCLVQPKMSKHEIRTELNLPIHSKLILFAPTWNQDDSNRNIFPFGHTAPEFLSALSRFAERHQATILLRPHLNSSITSLEAYPNIISLPSSERPNTEQILQISDILVCDWSSIAIDYLLLSRPTLFLDVPAPFDKGFSLGPEYRFGPIINNLTELIEQLEMCSETNQKKYWQEYADKHSAIQSKVYETWADGLAATRCLARLNEYIRN